MKGMREEKEESHRKSPRDLLTVRTVRTKGAWHSLISGSSLVKGDTARYARTKGFLWRGIAAQSRHIVCSQGGDRETSRSGREPAARDRISTSDHTMPNILINVHRLGSRVQ
ncbi:hypothetical protein ALC57_14358 [Trachymyrmex cornetzi]|uniref:Uncharacterized protein n=1 Tax=Trachymyrmex cornetzi TaxID=471704 RepID=A0A195DKC1_9HYME|nr:hypothetical protein ALC57_14358 [Trachymyrmex cornetzi]